MFSHHILLHCPSLAVVMVNLCSLYNAAPAPALLQLPLVINKQHNNIMAYSHSSHGGNLSRDSDPKAYGFAPKDKDVAFKYVYNMSHSSEEFQTHPLHMAIAIAALLATDDTRKVLSRVGATLDKAGINEIPREMLRVLQSKIDTRQLMSAGPCKKDADIIPALAFLVVAALDLKPRKLSFALKTTATLIMYAAFELQNPGLDITVVSQLL